MPWQQAAAPAAMAPSSSSPNVWASSATTISSLVGLSLVAGFLVGASRYRLWHSNRFLSGYLAVMSSPVYLLFNQFLLLTLKNPNFDIFDVASAVLLYVVFTSYNGTTSYKLDRRDRREEVKMQELAHLTLSFTLCWLILVGIAADNSDVVIYTKDGQRVPVDRQMEEEVADAIVQVFVTLFFIWFLTMFTIILRIVSFLDADYRYGVENSNVVALHMVQEHKTNGAGVGTRAGGGDDELDNRARDLKDYKYIVAGEHRVEVDGSSWEINLNYITTIDEVWSCKGRALREEDADLCLSFAMFKLFKRWMHGCPMAEAGDDRTRRFAAQQLLGDGERGFRLIATEAKFFLDLFYTKHSVTFGPWIILVNFINLAMTAFCIGMTVGLQNVFNSSYPKFVLAKIIFGFVVLIELTTLFRYLLSDWSKAILLAKHSKERSRMTSSQGTTAL